jgi:DNA mismatch repair protein MSH6
MMTHLTTRNHKIVYKDLGKEIFQIECPVGISVPSSWRLLSSTKAVKRYWSPEVEKKVRELLEYRELHKNVVAEMQGRLYARFDADYDKWMSIVRAIAHLDCLVGLAVFNETVLAEPRCRPEFVEGEGIRSFVEFEELRHPCILEGIKQDFIPNDVALGGERPNLVLLTGANMVFNVRNWLIIGWKIDFTEADLHCCNHGTSRMLCPCPTS